MARLKDPVSVTMDLERPDAEALQAIAEQRGVSVASLVRAAVRAYMRGRRRRLVAYEDGDSPTTPRSPIMHTEDLNVGSACEFNGLRRLPVSS